jgi:hypothetical protein
MKKLSQTQQALIYLLKSCNASRELITLVLLMLSKSDTATGAMILLLQDIKPVTEDHILRIAMGLVEMLPPEERTGEMMNLRIKL